MKKNIKRNIGLIGLVTALFMAGCSKNDALNLDYHKSKGSYYITFTKDGKTFSTQGASLGIVFDKNDFRTDDPIYCDYSSVSKLEDGLLAKGSITSLYGSTVEFTDYFVIVDGDLRVNREFVVTKAGEDYGFGVEQKWSETESNQIVDKDWFVPGALYINGEHTFFETSSRIYFDGTQFTVPADDASALLVASYKDKKAFSMLDTTPGYRETSAKDCYSSASSYLYVDENFNFAGIRVQQDGDNISYFHTYPSLSNPQKDKYIYRLLPVKEGFKRQISYTLSLDNYENYASMQAGTWRDAYDYFKIADKRYSLNTIYETLRDYIKNSFADQNMWGNIPQYMTYLDHYFPDSGFLYCNLEFATYMLEYGESISDSSVISNALKVIDYQLTYDCMDYGMRAYGRDNSVFKRVMFDGLGTAVQLYLYLLNSPNNYSALIDRLHSYIVSKAEAYKNEESLMALTFYMPIYQNADLLHLDYKDTAIRLVESAIEKTKYLGGYFGAIETSNTRLTCMEDYMLVLRGILRAYEVTKSSKYLEAAIKVADALESYNLIQPINMNPVGTTGVEGFNSGFIGNERFLGYGYAFNNTSHHILDIANTSSCIEYYKLYEITGDTHYLEFMESKLYNSFLYINMGDKVGHMDDPIHSSGKGFMNEFAGNSTIKDSYADGGVRGAVHDSNLGWNVYQVYTPLKFLKDIGYSSFKAEENLSHNLATNKVIKIEKDNIAHSVYNVIDRNPSTYFQAETPTSFVMDLNEQCFVNSINIDGDATVAISSDNVNFTEVDNLTSINSKTRYIRFAVLGENKVNEINVDGYPVQYKNLAVSSSIIDKTGSMDKCIDFSNYSTMWSIDSTNNSMVLDLGDVKEIYETSLKFHSAGKYKFKIETSIDNSTFADYANEKGTSSKYVHVNSAYAKARYVKLTINTTDSVSLEDFKVLGD